MPRAAPRRPAAAPARGLRVGAPLLLARGAAPAHVLLEPFELGVRSVPAGGAPIPAPRVRPCAPALSLPFCLIVASPGDTTFAPAAHRLPKPAG